MTTTAQPVIKRYGDHTPGTDGAIASIDLGNVHVGQTVASGLSLGNIAPAGSDPLNYRLAAYGGDSSLSGTAFGNPSGTLNSGGWADYTVNYTPSKAGSLQGQGFSLALPGTEAGGVTVPITGEALNLAAPRFILSGLDADDYVQRRQQTTRIELHNVNRKGHAPIGISVANLPQPGPSEMLDGHLSVMHGAPGFFRAPQPGQDGRFGNLPPGSGQTPTNPILTVTVEPNHLKGSASIDIGMVSYSHGSDPSTSTLVPLLLIGIQFPARCGRL
jgi:hypothetical protein